MKKILINPGCILMSVHSIFRAQHNLTLPVLVQTALYMGMGVKEDMEVRLLRVR